VDSQAGISGTPETGAWNIVVKGGGYKEVDKDEGDSIIYSAPGASDTKSKSAESESRGAKILLKSFETKQPVRVLRAKETGWKGAPYSGLRYDGLYVVEGKGEGKNKKGGIYISTARSGRKGHPRLLIPRPDPM
jgi:E3 ubiquitin-protein ligase UHRF1